MRKELSEEVKSKLRKILALAESGIDGEREAAKNKLQALLLEHGLTLEDLADDGGEGIWVFHNISNKTEQGMTVLFIPGYPMQKAVYEGHRDGNMWRSHTCMSSFSGKGAVIYWKKPNLPKEE